MALRTRIVEPRGWSATKRQLDSSCKLAEMQMSRPVLSGMVWGIVLNASIPVVLYKVSRRYLSYGA